MADRIVLTNPDLVTRIEKYGKQMELDPSAALEKLVTVAINRINALRKYAAKESEKGEIKKSPPAKKPAAKKQPEKKSPPKKTKAKKPEIVPQPESDAQEAPAQ